MSGVWFHNNSNKTHYAPSRGAALCGVLPKFTVNAVADSPEIRAKVTGTECPECLPLVPATEGDRQ